MKNDIKTLGATLTFLGMVVGGYVWIEDRVDAKTEKAKTEVKEDVDELKDNFRRKNEKQDEDLDVLKEYSIRQSEILIRVTDNLDKLEEKLK